MVSVRGSRAEPATIVSVCISEGCTEGRGSENGCFLEDVSVQAGHAGIYVQECGCCLSVQVLQDGC